MLRMVVFACMATALCLGQNVDPKNAKILKEQRFNAGDGRAGSAFATEDGQLFREETDAQGNRIGQYSYIGDNGQVFTVKYSAGKDGFRILEGDHIRATGQEAAPFNPQVDSQPAAAPIAPALAPVLRDYDYVEEVVAEEVDPNRNPFINPHDPTHRDFAFNKNGADFEPAQPARPAQVPAGVLSGSSVPDCADCAGVNPFVNPFDASHGGHLAGQLAGHQAGFVVPQQVRQVPVIVATTPAPTDAALRFFPPGQLKLNRFETGFNFDFQS